MPKQQPTTKRSPRRPLFTPQEQQSVTVLVASLLIMSVSYWWYLGGHKGQLIEIDRAKPLQVQFLVDINRADWPEIIQLPGLGETLAQRILADRRQQGPFRKVDELTRVNGIGPKTLEKIRPYLLPIPKDTDWAAVETASAETVQ